MLKEISRFFTISLYSFNPYAVSVLIVSVCIFFIGAFVLLQNKKSLLNRAFFLKCYSAGIWLFSISFVYSCRNAEVARHLYKYFTFFGVASIAPNLYLFSVVWADQMNKQKKFIPFVYVLFYAFYFLGAATNIFILPGMHRYFWGLYPIYGKPAYLFLACFSAVYSAAVLNCYRAYQKEPEGIRKTQKKMIAIIITIGYMGSFDFISKFTHITFFPVGYIAIFAYISLVAYTVVRYRVFDIETALHKTVLWLLSFSIIVFPVFFLYWDASRYIKHSSIAHLIFWTISFIIFSFYLRVVQPKIDHFFRRRRSNLEQILNKFAEDLVYLKGLDNLIGRIEQIIFETLYPQKIGIFLLDEGKAAYTIRNKAKDTREVISREENSNFLQWIARENKIIYRDFVYIDPQYEVIKKEALNYFEFTGAILMIPLVLNGKLIGLINLGKKAELKAYHASDLYFLNTLKNEAAIAISNSLLYENMEEQVRQRTQQLTSVRSQLVQAEKLATVGTLAGGVAHEINNPLAAILTNVQLLLDSDTIKDEDDKESLEIIEEATERCRNIVKKLMFYARKPLDSDELSVINMLDVVNKTMSFIGYQLEQENIKVNVRAARKEYLVKGNSNELEQVVTNIMLNAKDAVRRVKKKGTIHIALSKKNKHIEISIEDEGKGMPEDVQSKIFDPFFTTKDIGKGLGLGLSICHSIIQRHNGEIKVSSQLNKGTVFTISLEQAAGPKAD